MSVDRNGTEAPRLNIHQALTRVLERDIAGDPDWRLTSAARQWILKVVKTLNEPTGRGR